MDYSVYTDMDIEIDEYYVSVSDGVSLKVIDFIPRGDNNSKPIIHFIAGWISHISGWKDVLKRITSEFRTIYLETREKKSSLIPRDKKVSFTIERLAEDIKDVITKIIPEKRGFVLSGSSLGATAILEYLSLNIRNPECAILIGPNSEFRFPKIVSNFIPILPTSLYSIIKPYIKWYLKNFRLDEKSEKEQLKRYERTLDDADPKKLKANAIAIKEYKIWEKLYRIITPSLIIGASSDTLHGIDSLKEMVRRLQDAEYKELSSNKETHNEIAAEIMIDYINKKLYGPLPRKDPS